MAVLVYTPSHVDPATLAKLTVCPKRNALVDELVAAVRDETRRKSHQHHILVGARGSGKTHTLSLVVDRIRKDPSMASAVLAIVLAEEEVVRQPVDLLIRLLEQLRQELSQAKPETLPGANEVLGRLAGELAQLRAERDHGRAMGLATAALEHAATTLGRLFLAVVENLDALIGLGGDVAQAWELRKSLQENRGLLLLAAAPSMFGSIVDAEAPFHGCFRQHNLDELSSDEMIALVRKRLDFELAQPSQDDRRRQRLLTLHASFEQQAPKLRGLIAYTGGLPRFGHLLFDLAAESDASEMAALMARFLDEQTPFFQTRMDPRMVPGAELEVLSTLARAPGPLTTRQLAEAQRGGSVNATAVLLKRLRERGLVRESRSEGTREVRFDVAEPLLRVWRRFRSGRSEQEQILSLAEFVAAMFAPVDLRAERSTLPADSFSCRLLSQAIALHEAARPAMAVSALDTPGDGDELSRQAEEEFLHGSLAKARELMEAAVAGLAKNGASETLTHAYARLSHFCLVAGDPDRALAVAELGLAIAVEIRTDLGRANCIWSRGDVFFRLGRNRDAIAAFDLAETLYQKVGSDLGRANCIWPRGDIFFRLGKNHDAIAAFDLAEPLYQKVGDDLGRANCIMRRGDVLFRLGKNHDAIAAFDLAETLFQKVGFDLGRANCISSRGDVLFRLGKNHDAIAAFDLAETLFQKVGDDLGRANCIRSRGNVFFLLGKNHDAIAAFDLAETLFQKVGDDLGRANCISSRGDVFFRLGKNPDAIAAFDLAETLCKKVGSDLGRAICISSRGDVFFRLGKNPDAIAAFDLAEPLFQKVGDDLGRANCIKRRGDVFFRSGRNDDAIAAFDLAEPLFQKVGDDLGRANCQAGRGLAFFAQGQVGEGLTLLSTAACEAGKGDHAHNADIFGSLVFDGLAEVLPDFAPGKLREHIVQVAPALSAASDGEMTKNSLVRLLRALLQHLGPLATLDLLPILEAALPGPHAGFLRPARLAAEILAKQRPRGLPDEPEEVRRTVREFLTWADQQPPGKKPSRT